MLAINKNKETKKNHMKIRLMFIVTIFLFMSLLNTSFAATITVDGTDGVIDNSDSVCSISEAIINANDDAATHVDCVAGNGVDTISLNTDVVLTTTIDATLGNTGTAVISTAIIIEGNNHTLQRDRTVCNFNSSNVDFEFRILVNDTIGDLEINNLVIKNGCIDSNSSSTGHGGGIYNRGILALNNVTLENNQTNRSGGGIYNNGMITNIIDSIFSLNVSNGTCCFSTGGGGLFNNGVITTIDNTDFSKNDAKGGGGILMQSNSIITTLKNSSFSEHAGIAGGGILLNNNSTITIIENCSFSENYVREAGGGIYNRGTIETIQSSLFSLNTANGAARFLGGGGGINSTPDGVINRIENSTFSGNRSDSMANVTSGAGIFASGTLGSIDNCSFYANYAADAAAIITLNFINLSNSLFLANDSWLEDSDCLLYSGASANNNLSDDNTRGCPGYIATTLTASTVGPLADNGGPTLTHALLADSEALDASGTGATATDQRGLPADGVRDIGAYEAQAIELCPTALMTDGFTTIVNNADELIQAIECANINGDTLTDTINLGADITLSQAYENHSTYGRTGTPTITANVIINGQDHILQRDSSVACDLNGISSVSKFRILRNNDNLTLSNITIAHGCADSTLHGRERQAGGIFNEAILTLINTTFDQNQALHNGGAIFNTIDGNIEISTSTFSGNFSNNDGGALHNSFGRIQMIQDSIFSQNSARERGGATYSTRNLITIENSTFSENSAAEGGAIFSLNNIGTIKNTTFAENHSTASGGAIFMGGTITSIENTTFSRNSAGSSGRGGAIFTYKTISNIKNTTFSGNTAGFTGSAIQVSGGTINNLQNSLFHNNGNNECAKFSSDTFNGTNNISTNASGGCPGLLATSLSAATVGPLTDNGGSTLTHALLVGNQAINQGNINSTTTGQRGFIADGLRDIGAYEVQVPIVSAPANISMEATAATTPVSLGNASVTDVDETGLTAVADKASPFTVGVHTVTWSTTDSQGHIGTDTQTVAIVDTTAPTVIAPANIMLEATGATTAVILGTANASDIVDGTITAIANKSSPFSVGVEMVTWSAIDNAGNTGTAIQTVTITDTTAPIITLNGNSSEVILIGGSFIDGAIANDSVDGDITVAQTGVVDINTAGTYTLTYSAIDNAGNSAMVTQNIKVQAQVGGTISGLSGGNTVSITDGDETLNLGNGVYNFAAALDINTGYSASIDTQPNGSPVQFCVIINATGSITAGNVTNVNVDCSIQEFLVGGSVSGLQAGNNVIIEINPGNEQLDINSNGAFVFDNPLFDLSNYNVTVASNPSSPSQTCTITNATGSINAADVDNINVSCTDDTFFIGGTITGLVNGFSLLLQNNSSDEMIRIKSGVFVFATPLFDLENYEVTFKILPDSSSRDCEIVNHSGSINGDDIDDVLITCNFANDLIFSNGYE